MDSFVLAETLKYLYLLFANKEELTLEVDDFVFTTEAHLLPLSLARISNRSHIEIPKIASIDETLTEDFDHSCPNNNVLFPEDPNYAQNIRTNLKNLVENVCPSTKVYIRTLHASEFQIDNKEHLEAVRKMGITVLRLSDGKIKMVHNLSLAESPDRAQEGVMFMQEIVGHTSEDYQTVYYYNKGSREKAMLIACPAKFGVDLKGKPAIEAKMVIARPVKCCSPLQNADELKGKIVLIKRGECMFIDKAQILQKTGAIAGIVIDNQAGSSLRMTKFFSMDGNGRDDVNIPMVFLFSEEANVLLDAYKKNPDMIVGITDGLLDEDALQNIISNDLDGASKKTERMTYVDPNSSTKIFEAGGFILAQQRVQSLLSKLQNLKKFKIDLDQLASQISDEFINPSRDENYAYQQITRETDFIVALERLMKKEKILEIDQDLQIILARLRELVKIQTSNLMDKFCSNSPSKTLNPHQNRGAFIEFISSKTWPLRHMNTLFHRDFKIKNHQNDAVKNNVYVDRTGSRGLSDKDL